jgi:uncharacterized RDD family membrane protein YckC
MSQPPPQEPQPEDQPWQNPSGGAPQQDPYQQPQQPQYPPQGQPQYPPPPQGQPQYPPPPPPPGQYGSPQQPPPYGAGYAQPTPQPQPYGGGQQPPYDPNAPAYAGLPSYGGQTGYGYADPAEGLASRGARLGAGVIDWIILAVVGLVISIPFGQVVTSTTNSDGSSSMSFNAGGGFGGLLELIIFFAYFTVLHAKWEGQTVGKKALGIRLVRADDRGAVSVGQALGRAAVYYFSWWLCLIGGIINLAWILWDPRRQALHDKIAKTVVASAKPQDPNPYRTGPF